MIIKCGKLVHVVSRVYNIDYINEFCKFIVMASDGVWEFLSNEKVMEIVNKFYYNNLDSYAAAEKVIEEATKMWRKVKLIIFLFILIYFFYFFLYRKMKMLMIFL